MKQIIIFFAVLFSTVLVKGQENLPQVKGKPFSLFWDNAFRQQFHQGLDTLGVHGVAWLKFMVTKKGTLSSAEVSPGIPPMLADFLLRTLKLTDSSWAGYASPSWYVLPVRFTLQHKGIARPVNYDSGLLSDFFSPSYKEQKITSRIFLPVQEMISPFDENNSVQKMKVIRL